MKIGEDRYHFAGLVSAKATLQKDGAQTEYYLFTGPSRLREALATVQPTFPAKKVKHRRDDISVIK